MSSPVSAAALLQPPMPAPGEAPIRWIVSRRYDLAFFFGGALVSLAALALHFGFGASIVVIWWAWLLALDGPHMAAAYSRTYVDRAEWRERPWVLAGSLLAFAVGPAFLLANHLTGSPDPFAAFLGFAALYGIYHVVRQHYGFLALYKSVNKDFGSPLDFQVDRWALYVGSFAPYVYLMVTHPRARVLLQIPPWPLVDRIVVGVLVAAYVASLAAPIWRGYARFGGRLFAKPQIAYLLLAIAMNGLMYFGIARFEPVYAASRGPDEDFLLLNILGVAWHNVQYVALVWFHNRNRYSVQGEDFGPAAAINATHVRYLLACAAFSAVYLFLACWTGVFPGCALFTQARLGGTVTVNQLGLATWWGLALHHYWLDQKIWRIRGDSRLKRNLGLT